LVDHLSQADIVICSTSSAQYMITAEMVRAAGARRRRQTPTFFIDISVPRNIDPKIGTVENSFVFNIDDLKSLVLSNLDHRHREAQSAELIVNHEVVRFREVLRGLSVGPAITQLCERMREMAREELSRHRNDLGVLSAEQEAALENLLFSTIKKISHPIITEMRRSALEVQL
jgi:glutamyl-tRNA reductase